MVNLYGSNKKVNFKENLIYAKFPPDRYISLYNKAIAAESFVTGYELLESSPLRRANWLHPHSYSKLEGQVRIATDKEVFIIAKILGVPMEKLYEFYDEA